MTRKVNFLRVLLPHLGYEFINGFYAADQVREARGIERDAFLCRIGFTSISIRLVLSDVEVWCVVLNADNSIPLVANVVSC